MKNCQALMGLHSNLLHHILRKKERFYNTHKLLELESLSKSNHKLFWDKIRNLGPENNAIKKDVKVAVQTNNGVTNNLDIVIDKWQQDFSSLYKGPDSQRYFDSNLCENIMTKLLHRENCMNRVCYLSNIFLNHDISFDEISTLVSKTKVNKATGTDTIPNEILKYPNVQIFMYNLFTYCFNNSTVPSCWRQAVISPIPKPGKDPLEPLNHRGWNRII